MNRTTRTFATPENFWATVDNWAAQKGFSRKADRDGSRVYQKGIGLIVAPMLLQVLERGGSVTMQAWVHSGWIVRIFSLFMMPPEMGVESGGIKGVIPRNIARAAINDLLARLGQPPIP